MRRSSSAAATRPAVGVPIRALAASQTARPDGFRPPAFNLHPDPGAALPLSGFPRQWVVGL